MLDGIEKPDRSDKRSMTKKSKCSFRLQSLLIRLRDQPATATFLEFDEDHKSA